MTYEIRGTCGGGKKTFFTRVDMPPLELLRLKAAVDATPHLRWELWKHLGGGLWLYRFQYDDPHKNSAHFALRSAGFDAPVEPAAKAALQQNAAQPAPDGPRSIILRDE